MEEAALCPDQRSKDRRQEQPHHVQNAQAQNHDDSKDAGYTTVQEAWDRREQEARQETSRQETTFGNNACKNRTGMGTDNRGPKQCSEASGHEPHAVREKPADPTTEEQTTNSDDHTVFEDLAGIVRTSAADNGVHMWTHVTGEQGSSTRMEIAAAVLALHIKKAIFIGSDSNSMVDKAK